MAGEALGLSAGSGASLWPVAGLAACAFGCIGFSRAWRFWPVVFFFLLGLTLALHAVDRRHRIMTAIELRGGMFRDVFSVTGEPHIGADGRDGTRWVSFPTTYAGGKLNVVFRQPVAQPAPKVGEAWACAGWLERRDADDMRARRLWIKGKGAYAERKGEANPYALAVLLARAKRNLSWRLGIGLESRPVAAALNRAMVLGERASLPREMRQAFVKSGTIHVFAISGLHVMVVAQILLYVLVMLMFPVRLAGVVLMPVLWLYVLLIGAPASALRAATMASICMVAPIFWRRPDAMAAWEATLVIFALADPIGLFGIGSMLSFTVVLGILLFLRWVKPFAAESACGSEDAKGGRRRIRPMVWLGVSFAAWAAGVPIAAHVFSRLTPGGLVANLAMMPLASASVTASVCGALVSFVSETLAAHVNNLAALFTEAMAGVSWAVARIPGADIEIQPWSIPVCAAWYVGILLIFVLVKMVWLRRRQSLA